MDEAFLILKILQEVRMYSSHFQSSQSPEKNGSLEQWLPHGPGGQAILLYPPKWAKSILCFNYDSTSFWLFLNMLLFLLSASLYCCLCFYFFLQPFLTVMAYEQGRGSSWGFSPQGEKSDWILVSPSEMEYLYWILYPLTDNLLDYFMSSLW